MIKELAFFFLVSLEYYILDVGQFDGLVFLLFGYLLSLLLSELLTPLQVELKRWLN